MVHERHEANRHNAAGQIARWVTHEGIDYATVKGWTDGQWLHAAVSAGLPTAVKRHKPPSSETRRLVLGLLSGRHLVAV